MKKVQYNYSNLEPEYRFRYEASETGEIIAHISGVINCKPDEIAGDDDDIENEYQIVAIVGPYFQQIANERDIVAQVTVSGFVNDDSDEDDNQKWSIESLHCKIHKIHPSGAPSLNLQQIELNFIAKVKGEASLITNFSYNIVCKGSIPNDTMGGQFFNIDSPKPVRPQGRSVRIKATDAPNKDYFCHIMQPGNNQKTLLVMSGKFSPNSSLNSSDNSFQPNLIKHVVGPSWHDIDFATVYLNLTNFQNSNADEDDALGWKYVQPEWRKIKGYGPLSSEYRLQVSLDLQLKGDNSKVKEISYLIFAYGNIGEKKLNGDKGLKNAMRLPRLAYYDPFNRSEYAVYPPLPLPPNPGFPYINANTNLESFNKGKTSPEQRICYPLVSPSGHTHIVVSGNVFIPYLDNWEVEDESEPHETVDIDYNFIVIKVGPHCFEYASVVPRVFINSVESTDSDEVDISGYEISIREQVIVNGQLYLVCSLKAGDLQNPHPYQNYGETEIKILNIGYMVSIIGKLDRGACYM